MFVFVFDRIYLYLESLSFFWNGNSLGPWQIAAIIDRIGVANKSIEKLIS